MKNILNFVISDHIRANLTRLTWHQTLLAIKIVNY